ncbi:MAG: tRNA pseudouridine(55) synthase TruB [Clostridia bacterium]|nr:tRNA pseudouridine(55) synthase TruB [Clostridia bacterium]
MIIINKPKGYTSHDVVSKVKKILNIKKVGHTGTLDPNATGVLPLLLNDSTKLSKYLIEHDKEYEVILKLGIKTDTADTEGNIIEEKEVQNISIEQIEERLKNFIGKQEQYPPMYSAIKVNGKKLYEYARNGEKVEIKPRSIEIYNINLINFNNKENEIYFKVSCSKGTYIRSLCEDIAKKLNTIGYMKELNRTKVGRFKIEDAITLEKLENSAERKILSMQELLNQLPIINLNEKQIEKFINGVQISVEKEDGIYNIYTNKYLGTGIVKNRKVKRDIILKQ